MFFLTMDVYTLWIGNTLPLLQRIALASWMHFGHTVRLFTYGLLTDIPKGVILLDASTVLPESRIVRYTAGVDKGSPSLFANIFRYKFLYENGGCWIDADTVCLSQTMPTGTFVVSSESPRTNDPSPGHPNFAYVNMPAKSDTMLACYGEATSGFRNAAWGTIGPKLLAKHLKQEKPEGLVILPARTFCPLPYNSAPRIFTVPAYQPPDGCHGIHLWNQILHRRKISNNKRGVKGCFFDRICAMCSP